MIPTMIDRSQRALRVFSKSNHLRDLVSKLYIGVIQTLSRILAYYGRHAFPKLIQVTFKPGSFQQEMSDDIRTCKWINDAVQEELESCHVEMDRETNRATKRGVEIAKVIYENTGLIMEQGQNLEKQGRNIVEEMARLPHIEVALNGITKLLMGSPGLGKSALFYTTMCLAKNLLMYLI